MGVHYIRSRPNYPSYITPGFIFDSYIAQVILYVVPVSLFEHIRGHRRKWRLRCFIHIVTISDCNLNVATKRT